MKKVGKYFTITILLLLGLFFSGLLFLFFMPSANLFGITFISYNDKLTTQSYNIADVEKVEVNSRSYDIEVKSTKGTGIYTKIENHSLGYVHVHHSKLSVEENLSNSILTFNIEEPYGVAFKNNSKIIIYLPENSDVDLSIKNKNAVTNIDDAKVSIRNFTYETTNGNCYIDHASITGLLNINQAKANFELSSNTVLNKNSVNLKIINGRFKATSSSLGLVTILANDRGVILLNKCDRLTQTHQTSGGRIEAKTISRLEFSGTDTNIYAENITAGAIVNLSVSGEISIKELDGASDITTNSGKISINTCKSSLIAKTGNGNVKINSAYKKLFITTTDGNIDANFASTADFASESNSEERYFKAISTNGNITVSGVNSVNIEISKKGKADVTFTSNSNHNNVYGASKIKTNSGSIYVKVYKTSQYTLNSKTSYGNSRINLTQTEIYNGWLDKTVNKTINCSSSTNSIDIETTYGNVLMLDSNFYN